MRRAWTLAVPALVLALPVALIAQRPSHSWFGGPPARARLGIMVDIRANPDHDKLGATVSDVVDDSPADKAGLKAGDIVTRFNETPLGGVKADRDSESGPGQKLVELAHKLAPGDTVRLEYRRDGASQKVTVVAEERPQFSERSFRLEMPDMGRFSMPDMREFPMPHREGEGEGEGQGGPGDFRFFWFGRGAGDLDLTDMNEGLGEYFGTSHGVLVLTPPRDSIPLKAGDVILNIDGREPKSAAHALRILRSYEQGETVKVEIMRQKKRQTVSWTVPGRPEPRQRGRMHLERTGWSWGSGKV